MMKLLFAIPEAAAALGVGRSTIYGLMRDGSLKGVKIGQRRLIPADSVEAFVASLRAANDCHDTSQAA